MRATVRKNFAFDPIVVAHLEEIAAEEKTSHTKIIQELIEKRYGEFEKQKKIKAFNDLTKIIKESEPNPFLQQFEPDDPKVIQKVKAMMHE